MSNQDRLQRLNAYLISKGRQPKSSGDVNFVTQNIARVTTPKGKLVRKTTKKNENDSGINAKSGSKRSQTTPAKSIRRAKLKCDSPRKPLAPSKSFGSANRFGTMTPKRRSSYASNSPHIGSTKKIKNGDTTNDIKKKPAGRRISITSCKQARNAEKTPLRHKSPKYSLTPSSRLNTSLRRNLLKTGGCKSVGSTPQKGAISKPLKNAGKVYEKLNSWLLTKGKRPFGLEGKLSGFKPAKVIVTPVNSPDLGSQISTPSGKSHWQGLRDEDDFDELTILTRSAMNDVKNCIKEGCPLAIIRSTLEEMVSSFPKVKQHASYWITLAQVEHAAGSDKNAICNVFEEAVLEKAQPMEEIQKALNEWALLKVCDESPTSAIDQSISNEKSISSPEYFRDVPTNQTFTPNHAYYKTKGYESPAFKNAATSPFVFESPVANEAASGVCPNSPSSVVKLRMVSRSSPVFARLKSLKTLPDDASAIITPVRRSTRIAAAQENYPKGLRDHEPCLSSVQEIFPALTLESSKEDTKVSCDVVYDPNLALGQAASDIATVLKF